MKVRVFVPRRTSSTDNPVFCGTDHTFPGLPGIGQALRFTDHRQGDFAVVNVGYVQDGDAFIPAVWLASSDTQVVYTEEASAPRMSEHRDLNYDVPPAMMTTY
jgi:hypothetical protein